MSRESRDQAIFDESADQQARKDLLPASAIARESQLLAALRPIWNGVSSLGKIVEVGCGIGAPAKQLDGFYEAYVGIDQSPQMIAAARRFNVGNDRATFLADNIKTAAVAPKTADLILSIGALHHMTDLDSVMVRLHELAKPGARFVAREPQNGNPLIQGMRWVRGKLEGSYSEEQIFFSEKQLMALFRRHHIEDLQIVYQGYFTPPLAQVVMKPQAVFTPLSRLSVQLDEWFNWHMPKSLGKLSFNVAVTGRFGVAGS